MSDKDYPALSVTMKGIVPLLDTAAKTDDGDNRKLVVAGDYVINSRSDRKGSGGISDRDGSVSLISIVLEPDGVAPEFAHHLLRSVVFQEEFYRWGSGIVADLWTTRYSDMKNIRLAIPPLEEQRVIAGYLDRETGRIDALVERLERLIALLTEKRQAVISHAVTKGLNPDAPMKDSGIDWLGEVPAHWEISRFAWINRPDQSITYGIIQAGPEVENGVPYIRVSDMQRQPVDVAELPKTSHEIASSYRRSELIDGDIVVCIRASIGKPMLVTDNLVGANLTQGTAKISPGDQVNRNFVFYAVQSDCCMSWFGQFAKGATFKEITLECLRNTPIPVPPRSEQEAIVDFLETVLCQVDEGIHSSQSAIDNLKERRSALISAAVTGQIPLADMTEEDAA